MTAMLETTATPIATPSAAPYVFSSSRLAAFDCPHQWYETYVKDHRSPPSEPTVVGSAIHSVFSVVIDNYVTTGKIPGPRTAAMKAIIDPLVEKAKKTELCTKTALDDIGRMSRKALAILDEVSPDAIMLPSERKEGREAEYHATVQLPWLENAFIQIFADLLVVNGTKGRIIDLKSGRKPYDVVVDRELEDQVPWDRTHQLLIYAWVLQQLFPEVTEWSLELHFLRFGTASKVILTAELLQKAEDYIRDRSLAIMHARETSSFPAIPGKKCVGCHAALTCPAAVAPVSLTIWEVSDAALLAGHMLANEARLELQKQTLRRFCELNEELTIEVNGEHIGFFATENQVWDNAGELAKVLAQELNLTNVIDVLEYYTPNNPKLRKLAEDVEAVANLGTWKQTSRQFTHKAKSPDLD